MKKLSKGKYKFIAKSLFVVVLFFISVKAIAVWVNAPQGVTAPNGSVSLPFNTGTTTQVKPGGVAVSGFRNFLTTILDGDVTIGGNVGIGTDTPTAKLEVVGGFKITDGTQGVNKILVSDASGLTSWSAPSITAGTFTTDVNTGGHTIFGNTTASGDLILNSTTDATKGNVILNPTSGRVGIGTSSPLSTLQVVGDVRFSGLLMPNGQEGVSGTVLTSSGAGSAPTWAVPQSLPSASSGQTLRFNGSNWVASSLIYNDGTNIGIGTVSPGARLEVNADAKIHGATVGEGAGSIATNSAFGAGALSINSSGAQNTAIGGNALSANGAGTANTALGYNANVGSSSLGNVTVLGANTTCSSSNTVCLGNSSISQVLSWGGLSNPSDRRLKENIVYSDKLGLDFILKLKPVSYNYISDTNKTRRDGLIAQDVKQAMDELGVQFSGLSINNDELGTMSLSYDSFVVPLITATKEQQAKIDALQNKVTSLDARISALEASSAMHH